MAGLAQDTCSKLLDFSQKLDITLLVGGGGEALGWSAVMV